MTLLLSFRFKYPFLFITILYLIALTHSANAQNIPNSSFDSIYFGGIDRIFEWVTSDGVELGSGKNGDTILPLSPNTFYDATGLQYSEILDYGVFIDTTPYSNFALRLKSQPNARRTDGSIFESFAVNGNHFYTDSNGYIDFSRCGTPFTFQPLTISGYYKFSDLSPLLNNFGRCEVLLKKYNPSTSLSDTIAYSNIEINFYPSTTWKPFQVQLDYRSALLPDSIVVVFYANSQPNQESVFWVDEIGFQYVTTDVVENPLSNVSVFPNPTSQHLFINNLKYRTISFEIYDCFGRFMMMGTAKDEIDVSKLEKQVYLIKLVNEDGEINICKFIKI